LRGESREAITPARFDEGGVVIHPDTVAVEKLESASETAADVENESEILIAQPPSVRVWDEAFPAGLLDSAQPVGVVI
jgi:hypothetical protein